MADNGTVLLTHKHIGTQAVRFYFSLSGVKRVDEGLNKLCLCPCTWDHEYQSMHGLSSISASWSRQGPSSRTPNQWGNHSHMVHTDCHTFDPLFSPQHQPKTHVFTKNCHPKSYFFHCPEFWKFFLSKTPNRLEFEKKVPKCPLFLWLLWLKDPLFFALHTHGLFEGNVANRVRSWKILYFSKQNCAIWWILSGANLIKVMKIKFQFYRLNRPNCALWMNFIGGQGWFTGCYHPSQTWKGIYPTTTLYKSAHLAL